MLRLWGPNPAVMPGITACRARPVGTNNVRTRYETVLHT